MLPSLFASTTVPLLEQVVNFTEARHGVLAGNIANLDTPGYRTRDLSPQLFHERLKSAVEAQHDPAASADGYGNYDQPPVFLDDRQEPKWDPFQDVANSVKGLLRHDENNVGMEQQVNQVVKNQMEHNLAVAVMSAQFRLLRAAVTERVA